MAACCVSNALSSSADSPATPTVHRTCAAYQQPDNFYHCSFHHCISHILAVICPGQGFFGDLDQASVPHCAMTGAVLDGSEEGQKLAAQTREALKRKRQALEDGKTEDGEDKASYTGIVLLSSHPMASGTCSPCTRQDHGTSFTCTQCMAVK